MKLFFIVSIFLLSFSANAEDSLSYSYQKWSLGVHSGVGDFRPHTTFNFGRHQFGASVIIDKVPNYFLDLYSLGGYHYYLGGQTGRKLKGGSLFYRIYPFRPRESFSLYFENYVDIMQSKNLYVNGGEAQKVNRVTESVLIGVQYKFLERFSLFAAFGPAVTYYFGNVDSYYLESGKHFIFVDEVNYHASLLFGLEIGIK
jgi:hypothetical protein